MFLDLNYSFNDEKTLYFRYKQDVRNENNADNLLSGLQTVQTSRYRLHFKSAITENIRWSNRIELADYKEGKHRETGWMVYQDLKYGFTEFPLSFTIRYAFFDTESYATRIYAYEHDLLYAFAIPAYYSKGYRTYINLHYERGDVDLYGKVAQTKYMDKEEISSGPAKIEGNTKTEVKLQLMVRF
jgi:hypothetical protein